MGKEDRGGRAGAGVGVRGAASLNGISSHTAHLKVTRT